VDVWSLPLRRKTQSSDRYRSCRTGEFPTRSDSSSKAGCGLARPIVQRRLKSGLAKFERRRALAGQEADVPPILHTFIWKPAFSDEQLFREFRDVLVA